MSKKKIIQASEIGTYVFCPRAWGLEQLGYRSQNRQAMEAGTHYHHAIGQRERLTRLLTVLLIIVLLCLLTLLIRHLLK